MGVEWLEQMHDLAGPATGAALESVAATLSARALADELRESTRPDEITGRAVKSYAYMDRGGVVRADIHEGLETTVTVLATSSSTPRSRSSATTTAGCRR